jgi:hypothetical protein
VRRYVLIFIFLFVVKIGFSLCVDNRTITEILVKGSFGNIFTGVVISGDTDSLGNSFSWIKITELFYGSVDSSVVKVYQKSISTTLPGKMLWLGEEYLIYAYDKEETYSCCGKCDKWSKEINSKDELQNELKILREFSSIFNDKQSGLFEFKYANGSIAGAGNFKNGVAVGDWKHYPKQEF